MLTWNDCIDLTDLTEEDVDAIAEHEHLTPMAALEKGACLLDHPWGEPALRQMAWDNLSRALATSRRQRAARLESVFSETCSRHPGGTDRRHLRRF